MSDGKTVTLDRMVLPEETCRFGLRAKQMLEASALIVGTAKANQILADHAALRAKVPSEFWSELRAEDLVHPDAAILA